MCDVLAVKSSKKFVVVIFIVCFILSETCGYSNQTEKLDETGSKQNLPASNVQVHYNETNNNNTNYITTITLDIDFVHNTTSTSIINHRPIGDLPFCGCYCGLGNRKHRIVGGNVTKVNEFPWIAAMFRKGKFYCGGALISRRHMLTAAHCVYGFNINDLKVVLGEHDRDVKTESETVEKKIKSAKYHPKFDLYTFNNDIAVIELESSVPLGISIKTACLPEDIKYNYTGRYGIIAGWGRIEESKPTSNKLRQVSVPIMSAENCRKSGYMGSRITENMICAGYEKGKKDACQGDSGGPMVVETTKGNLEIAGIVSWGRGCARPNYPGVYTKVANYLPWIQETIGDECFCQRP